MASLCWRDWLPAEARAAASCIRVETSIAPARVCDGSTPKLSSRCVAASARQIELLGDVGHGEAGLLLPLPRRGVVLRVLGELVFERLVYRLVPRPVSGRIGVVPVEPLQRALDDEVGHVAVEEILLARPFELLAGDLCGDLRGFLGCGCEFGP
jgi:hypothetical protein